MIHIKPQFSDTATVNRAYQKLRIGKWRLYDVIFLHKHAMLLTDHPVRSHYHRLHRFTNYKFIGLERKENE